MSDRLFKAVDNAPLIIFRIFFGALIAAESFGAIATGWVHRVLVAPDFTFSIRGFEWLQPLPGNGMYFYFIIMGICGLLIMLGFYYRIAIIGFTLLWAGVYFMQTSAYNNHYYLLLLVSFSMVFLPANSYASLDVKRQSSLKQISMPQWIRYMMITQMTIVYFYATLAKIYPDWLDGTFTGILFSRKADFPLIGDIFSQKWFHLFIAYAGIAFDGLIVPLLLFRKTRIYAFLASLFFHLFNSIVLQIGIFPFFALSYVVFFYEPDQIRRWFFRKKTSLSDAKPDKQHYRQILKWVFVPFFVLQLILPLRHYLIAGNVFWTEEGHRHSWRMMLRTKGGSVKFRIVDKTSGEEIKYNVFGMVTKKQSGILRTKAETMWHMAQRLQKEFAQQGIDIAVYVDAKVSLNGGKLRALVDPEVDLCSVNYSIWKHNDWIINYPKEEVFAK